MVSKSVLAKFAALAESNRMNIIQHLAVNKDSPPNVGEVAEAIGLEMVSVSHHLGVLESAGLITREKNGRSVRIALDSEVFNYSNKEDSVGYFAFDGYKVALPGGNAAAVKKAAKAPAASKPAGKKKAAPAPAKEEKDDDDGDE